MVKQILVVGAGVTGLTTALVTKERLGSLVEVHLIAQYLPGDDATFYTSPKAGAHWSSSNQKENKEWQKVTYKKLKELSKIPEAFVKPYPLYMGEIVPEGEKTPEFEDPWFKDFIEEYEFLGSDPRFAEVKNLYRYQSYTISTGLYLVWLLGQLRSKGVSIQRHTIKSLKEAENYTLPNGKLPDLVVNCTGLGHNFLQDGGDKKLKPVRGHVLLVENNLPYQVTFEQPYTTPGMKKGEFLMLFPRPEGGSVLGGIYDRNFLEFDTSIDKAYVERLQAKVKKHLPELLDDEGQLKISKHVIGFRPEREGGARIELQGKILHNYGNGNSGYIESWGGAESTVEEIQKFLFKAKL